MSTLRSHLYFTGMLLSSINLANADTDSSPHLGKKPAPGIIQAWNISIFTDGTGLPSGYGSVAEEQKIYTKHCLSCHGEHGQGDSAEELAGGQHLLTDEQPDKTIGTYWPYAITLFDFIHRVLPMDAPGTLTADQIYAVTAYLLFLNHIIDKEAVLDRTALTNIKMPNRNGFINMYVKKRKQHP